MASVFSFDHVHGPVQQHDGEDEDGVDEGQDAAYLTNLDLDTII